MTNSEYMDAAGEVARAAGRMIRERMKGGFSVGTKSEKHDYVTEVDVASEKLVRDELRKRFPGHLFFGEEEASADPEAAGKRLAAFGADDHVWFVDPLDGTTNFVRGLPLFCVSIALAKGGEIIAGAVMDPSRDELFSAALGGGAWLDGGRVGVSEVESLADAIVSTSLPTALHPGRAEALRNMGDIFPQVSSARVFHCAALCLANVAAGRTDGHWEYGLNVWDMAAGALLVTEAGGRIADAGGGAFSIYSRGIVCSNGILQADLCRELEHSNGG